MKTVTALYASLHVSSLLRDVEKGETIEIISHGRAVALISPVPAPRGATDAAKTRLLLRLRSQDRAGVQAWVLDDLYHV